MPNLALSTALTGLRVARTGMDVTSHNVANVNNDAHTRQRVEQSSLPTVDRNNVSLGTGVTVDDISRERDVFLDDRLRRITATDGANQQRAELLSNAEAALLEPESGLTAALDEVWAGFERLSEEPEDDAVRVEVVGALSEVAANSRELGNTWGRLAEDGQQRLEGLVDDVNRTAEQLAALNEEYTTGSGRTDNDLADQRDAYADELARMIGATVTTDDVGRARVSVGGMEIVSATTANELTVNGADVLHPTGAEINAAGEVGGVQRTLEEDLPAVLTAFTDAVGNTVDALNTQHAAGRAPDGSAGGDLFTFTGTLESLDVAVEPDELAAASGGAGVPDTYDGANAEAIADLRTTAIAGGDTPEAQLRSGVTELAGRASSALSRADGSAQQLVGANQARSNAHGVNLDEEMAQLLSYQRAFEASSRVLTAADEALDTLINRTGIVGR